MLVALAVLSLIMILLAQAVTGTSSIWTRSVGKVQAFQGARAAFEAMTRNLSQATLQNYYGYADSSGNPIPLVNPSFKPASGTIDRNKVPSKYLRLSELHFLCGPTADIFSAAMANVTDLQGAGKTPGQGIFFQAPVGFSDTIPLKPSLLNNCGYYLQFERDDDNSGKGTGAIPSFANPAPTTTYRYRLMEVMQPAEKNGVYQSTDTLDANGMPQIAYDLTWLTNLDLGKRSSRHVIADNIPLLVFLPKLSPENEKEVNTALSLGNSKAGDGSMIAPKYVYDSRSWITASNASPPKNYSGNGLKRSDSIPLVENIIMNRLPPIVRVLMVAIDERSAVRVIGTSSTPPTSLLNSLYGSDGKRFTDASKFDADLVDLQKDLNKLTLNYRIFQTEVRLPNAAFGQ